MIKTIISDFSKVLLFLNDNSKSGKLNELHQELLEKGSYDFWEYFTLNDELLNYYKSLSPNVGIYIFTSEFIQEHPPVKEKLDPIFKGVYSAARLGVSKIDPEAYKVLIQKIGINPNEAIFVDDTVENIEAAKIAGLKTVLFKDTARAIIEIAQLLD